MDVNLNLGLVSAQYDEALIQVDADKRVSGVLALAGVVDAEWRDAFAQSAPPETQWRLEETPSLTFGPIRVEDFAASVALLRDQIAAANASVEVERHKRAMAAYIDEQERERARQTAIDTLSNVFGRRLSES